MRWRSSSERPTPEEKKVHAKKQFVAREFVAPEVGTIFLENANIFGACWTKKYFLKTGTIQIVDDGLGAVKF